MRIGVVADTHVGECIAALPDEVLTLLDGVDLILHAGDLSVPSVLDDLGAVAPVVAVGGNHDRHIPGLPRAVVVRVGDHRIGLTHGARPALVEVPSGVVSVIAGRPVLLGFDRMMRGRFGPVDCIVTGHLHMPADHVVDGVRHFSPGAVYVAEADPRFDWGRLGARAYRRYRAGAPAAARVPAIGMIEVDRAGLRTRRIPLSGRAA